MKIEIQLDFEDFCFDCPCWHETESGDFCYLGYWDDTSCGNEDIKSIRKKPIGHDWEEPVRPKACIDNHGL